MNSAHPLENPTPLSNFIEVLAILLIAAALAYTFGTMVKDTRQGWAVLAAMTIVFVSLLAVAAWAENRGNPVLASLGVDQTASAMQAGGNMEGKEVRYRHRQLRALGHRDNRRIERLGQLDARLIHTARWLRADVADAARRSDLRRRRVGALRHARCSRSSPCSSPD